MNRQEQKGSITVFLSITCILFLALISALVESARVQGAKTQSANITGMGSFSLLGEFEKELLERYEIFALDGAYGEGTFDLEKVKTRFDDFSSYNANPKKNIISFLCLDPWNLQLKESEITKYALLTDEKGEAFYQQVVSYMQTNAAFIAVDRLMEYSENLNDIETWQDAYKTGQRENKKELKDAEKKEEAKRNELEVQAANGEGTVTAPVETVSNPLTEINKLKNKSILDIVTWDKTISEKECNISLFPSHKRLLKGNMKIQKKHSGLLADLLFREYLMMYFPNYIKNQNGASFQYQMEYILGGKSSDKANLKYVVNKLLLIREGMNYMYCVGNGSCSQEAEGLAISLTGWLGMPAVTAVTKHALLLAWAYCESLVDVRILLDGGKVPLFKDQYSWTMTLENLSRITEVLQNGAKDKGEGYDYEGYLRILLHMGRLSSQKMRALDMIQYEIKAAGYNVRFEVQNCIVGLECCADWYCKPVFARFPAAVFGLGSQEIQFRQKSSIAY